MLHCAGGGEDYGASWGESKTHQTLAGDLEIGEAVGCDLHDAARAGEGGCDVEIAVHVEGQSLRPSQPLIESGHGSVGIDLVNAIGGTGDEQVAVRTEGKVIGGDAGFERGENEDLLVGRDLEDGAVAIADVETLRAVKRDPCGDAHAFRISRRGSVGSHLMDGTVEAGRDIHLS